jgi:TRAP-type transport system periplasmic protein
MFKKIAFVFIVFIALSAFTSNLNTTQEPKKVRFGSIIPKDSPWDEGITGYLKNTESKSNGKLKFKSYFGGQLGGEVEMIKSVAMGSLEGGAFTTAAIAEAVSLPALQIFEMPFLFNSDAEADYVMDKMFDPMSKFLEMKGLVLVLWGTNGWRCFGTKTKPIYTPADLKGLKMRSQESEVYVKFYEKLGATPLPLATPDVLVALKTGMVDGFDQTPVYSLSTGWVNTGKHFTLSKHIYQPGAIVFSKKFFDKLSEEEKKAILSKDNIAQLQQNARQLIRNEDDAVLGIIKDSGVNVIELTAEQRDAFKKATAPVYKEMEQKIGPNMFKLVNTHIKNFRAR